MSSGGLHGFHAISLIDKGNHRWERRRLAHVNNAAFMWKEVHSAHLLSFKNTCTQFVLVRNTEHNCVCLLQNSTGYLKVPSLILASHWNVQPERKRDRKAQSGKVLLSHSRSHLLVFSQAVYLQGPCGTTVVCLTPDHKVVCSNHIRGKAFQRRDNSLLCICVFHSLCVTANRSSRCIHMK